MQDGETGAIEIERIGRMTVKVEDPQKCRWSVGIDRGIGKAVRQMKLTGVTRRSGRDVSNEAHSLTRRCAAPFSTYRFDNSAASPYIVN